MQIFSNTMEDYKNKDETYKIIGILFEVHKNLGKGFSEIVYKDALKHKFYPNFLAYNKITLENKTVDCFNNSHYN